MSERPSTDTLPGALQFRRAFLLLLAVGISILFVLMIRRFLLTVLLAAILAGLAHPIQRGIVSFIGRQMAAATNHYYRRLLARMGRRIAAAMTLLLLVGGVALPTAGFLMLVTAEAVQLGAKTGEWLQEEGRMDNLLGLIERIPFADHLLPEVDAMVEQIQEAAGGTGPLLMGAVTSATWGTLNFFLQLFVLLYSLFFFLADGPIILRTILQCIPLEPKQKDELLERFLSVTRATLKGSLLIGLIQGGLAGLAFWVAGVPGPAFWGVVMVVLSVLPAIGATLVWIPATIYLFMMNEVTAGIGLAAWCAIVVGTADNLLRPRLIGRDARMSDLLIFLSTVGGIILFGAVGFIVGPIVAALFVTVWHIYGEVFRDWLPGETGDSLLWNEPDPP